MAETDAKAKADPRRPAGGDRLVPALVGMLVPAGWACSVVLLVSHLALARDGGLGLRICSAGSDCATVLKSRHAVLLGMPLAAWGMLYFTALGGWLVAVGLPRGRCLRGLLPLAITTVGAAGSVVCIYWMICSIGAVCPWCMAAHFVNFLLLAVLVAGWLGLRGKGRPVRKGLAALSACVLGVQLAVAVSLAGVIHDRSGAALGRVERIVRDWRAAPVQQPAIGDDELVYGRPDAPHTLVMFSDFRCHYCWESHEALTELLDRMPGKLRVVVKQFPFHPECNPTVLVARRRHESSCPAARAALAARAAGGPEAARRYTDLLFEAGAEEELADERFAEVAQRAGIDPAKWRAAYADRASAARLGRDIAEGKRLKVAAVPTFLLDGRLLGDVLIPDADTGDVDWPRTMELWRRLLGEEAAGATGGSGT